MAHDRLGHASLARCSQNLPRRIRCRQGADRWPTRTSLEVDCPAGHRPSDDRNYRPNIGCCRSRDRRRAIPPGRQVGICLSVVRVVAGEAISDDSAADAVKQIINPLWTGTAPSYSASWVWRSDRLSLISPTVDTRWRGPPPACLDSGSASAGVITRLFWNDHQ